jgi:Domain of unknown function (DUF4382)
MKGLVFKAAVLMGISFGFWGCSNANNPVTNNSSTTSGNTGILKIMMIDSPANYSQVNIVVDSVQAHISTSDSTGGWYTLNNVPATYDLLTLVNGANAVIGQDTLPAGNYSQIRLYIGSGSNVVLDGQNSPVALTTPSGSQSGVKLNVDATIQAGFTYNLTIDFDAARSIVKTGSPTNPKYILKPVIKTAATATSGNISGIVSPDTVTASVWAIIGTDSSSTSTDTTGGFKLFYLTPGTYDVVIAPIDTADYRDTTITNVSVTALTTTDLGTIILTHK